MTHSVSQKYISCVSVSRKGEEKELHKDIDQDIRYKLDIIKIDYLSI